MKIALIGYGKMGKAVEQLAKEEGKEIIGPIRSTNVTDLSKMEKADVGIDFSTPIHFLPHFTALLSKKIPLIVGSTGWEKECKEVSDLVEKEQGSFLYGANFSTGISLFTQLLRVAAKLTDRVGSYQVGGMEVHHRGKKDSPSGTAKQFIAKVKEVCPDKEVPFSSLRLGSFVGTHRLFFDSPDDTIELHHSAKNRQGFARGALEAAKWLMGKQGFFTFDDFIEEAYLCPLMA